MFVRVGQQLSVERDFAPLVSRGIVDDEETTPMDRSTVAHALRGPILRLDREPVLGCVHLHYVNRTLARTEVVATLNKIFSVIRLQHWLQHSA